jgi:hypothetical protein
MATDTGKLYEVCELPMPTREQVTVALARFAEILCYLERGSPRPLCIDGHAYHRRQRARRRRGR